MSKTFHVAQIPSTTGAGGNPDQPAKPMATESGGLSHHLMLTCGTPVTVYALWRVPGAEVPNCGEVVSNGYPLYQGKDTAIEWNDLDTGVSQDPAMLYFAAILPGGDVRGID